MDVYTEFGARTSKYKNPVNDVGVQKLYGNELKGFEKIFFKLMFTGKLYSKIYRLYELGKNKIKILLNKCTLKICQKHIELSVHNFISIVILITIYKAKIVILANYLSSKLSIILM